MASRSGRLSQDRNLGVHIDGEASFKGKKKTRRASVRKSIADLPNSGEPSIINKPGEKKAQDGPLISGKQLKSEKLASVKEEAVPSTDENLNSKRIASKVPEKPQNMKALSDIAYSKLRAIKTQTRWTKGDLDDFFCDDYYDHEKCSESLSPRCQCEIANNPRKEEIGSPTINGLMPERFEIDPNFWVVKPLLRL